MLNFKHKQSGVVRNVTKAIAFSSYFMCKTALANESSEPIEPPEPTFSAVYPNGARPSMSARVGLNGRAVLPTSIKITADWGVNSSLIRRCFLSLEGGKTEQGGYLQDNVSKEERAAHGTFASIVGGCKAIISKKVGLSLSAQFFGANSEMYNKNGEAVVEVPFNWNKLPFITVVAGTPYEHPHKPFELMSGRITTDFGSVHANLLFSGIKEINSNHLLYIVVPFYNNIANQNVVGLSSSILGWMRLGHYAHLGLGGEGSVSANINHGAFVMEGLGKVCLSFPIGIGFCGAGGYAGVKEVGQYHADREPNSPLVRVTALLKFN